jgi:hypothetical protein
MFVLHTVHCGSALELFSTGHWQAVLHTTGQMSAVLLVPAFSAVCWGPCAFRHHPVAAFKLTLSGQEPWRLGGSTQHMHSVIYLL